MKRARGFALAAVAAAIVAVGAAAPVRAQASDERITSFTTEISVAGDASMQIHERISYDFGGGERHGIFRDLVVEERYDDRHDRRYEVTVLDVTMDGATVPVDQSTDNGLLRLRIGDPDRLIGGRHDYDITYRVVGGPRAFPDHDELSWDAVGDRWEVPIDQADVRVTMPATIDQVACYAGPTGSTLPCNSATTDGASARFTGSGLAPGSALTVVVGVPSGTLQPPPQPLLVKRRTLGDAFALTPLTGGLGGLLTLVGVGGVGALAWRHGRDRRAIGSAVDQAFAAPGAPEERVPVRAERAGPVEFAPPDKVRPGQIGVLIDEKVDLVDVTATIIDLAVRGWVRIVEVPKDGRARQSDYELQRLTPPERATLLPYEALLVESLFGGGSTVRLSELKQSFTERLNAVRNAMYDDLVEQGWYRSRPDRTRAGWIALAIVLLVVGIAVTIVVAVNSSFGLLPLALPLSGLTLLILAGRMPARTAAGTAMLSRSLGFRRLFDEGEEDVRARFAEERGIFSQYLPYAIAFGCADRWAHAFRDLGAEQLGTTGWWSGPDGFTALAIAHGVSDFGRTAVGTMYAPPASSSSSGFGGGGFSGGGGGGGGGGSW